MATHVVPADDAIDHETTDGCPCGPRAEPVKRMDGSVGWVYVHNSLDGREDHEQPASYQVTEGEGGEGPQDHPLA